jgi:hypothetical protein
MRGHRLVAGTRTPVIGLRMTSYWRRTVRCKLCAIDSMIVGRVERSILRGGSKLWMQEVEQAC